MPSACNFRAPLPNFRFQIRFARPAAAENCPPPKANLPSRSRPARPCCLAPTPKPAGLSGEDYRRARAQAAWALESLDKIIPAETIDGLDWRWLAGTGRTVAGKFSRRRRRIRRARRQNSARRFAARSRTAENFPARRRNGLCSTRRRVTLVPPGHWLLIQDTAPFRATLQMRNAECGMRNEDRCAIHVQSIAVGRRPHRLLSPRAKPAADAELLLERYAATSQNISPPWFVFWRPNPESATLKLRNSADLVLLTNGLGGMARLCVDLGRVNSKYDCVLGANLNPTVPVDRHVFVKRTPRLGQRRRFSFAARFQKSRVVPGRPARRLAICRQRRRRPHGGNRIARRNARRQKHDRFPFQPADGKARARQTIARRRRRAPDRALRHRRPEFSLGNQTQRRRGLSFLVQHACVPDPRPKIRDLIRLCLHARADRQLRVFADARRISSAAGMVRKHSASGRAKRAARPAAATPTAPAGLKCRCQRRERHAGRDGGNG